MYFDRRHQVEKLVLIGSGTVFHPADETARTLKVAFANAQAAMGSPTLESCRRRMANICYKPEFVAAEMLLVQLTSYALPDRFPAYKATMQGTIDALSSDNPEQHRVYSRLEEIKVPTLVLTGREDIRAQLKMHEAGVKRMPNAELVIFEQCSHLPYMEYPQRFNDTAVRFLTRA